jgi:BirA family biotin operon repressor/biotin-[acetyl-CoA-carboxylase] ligase
MMRSPKRFPVPLVHINETNSTNNYLQALCARQQTEEFTTVVADFQTSVAIRGKQNLIRTFFSVL